MVITRHTCKYCESENIVLNGKINQIHRKILYGTAKSDQKNLEFVLLMLGASFDFGAAKVDTKSNEKTAIPKLLKSIDLTNSIITIDAIAREQKNTDLIVQTIAKVSINKLAIDLSCSPKTQPN